ncbi:hypothetical protein SAMN02745121_08341 [Nannocystis exedens]|uniref:Uncharacterized protein n=1 Tax=Nannocystis exedens TaxID=54 RepID=A0A1I2I4R2_9BACT|nr:hypothetical protein NAEX_06622 [Nannocystis exedens]SFF35501.1 hypothetical protein SAMN02745121_08341 [Nannocystis exedens]
MRRDRTMASIGMGLWLRTGAAAERGAGALPPGLRGVASPALLT